MIQGESVSNLNRLVKQFLYYLGVNGVIAILLFLSLAITAIISRRMESSALIFVWTIALALILALFIPLLWQLSRPFFARVLLGQKQRDEKKIIQHYSQ